MPGARNRRTRAAADRRRDRQQRLARDGATVAGTLLRRALCADAPHAPGAGLCAARRGVRLRRVHRRQRGRPRGHARGRARVWPHGRRRRACRPERELLPDGARGRRRRRRDRGPRRRGPCVSEHTISVRLENKPGALARVSQLFSRRGYNIQSLAVGPTERRDISRLTLRVDCNEQSLEQIEKQMHKLVNVLRVTELRPENAVESELALVTVASPPDTRAQLLAAARASGASIADFGQDAITFQIVGRPEDVDAFEDLLRPYGVLELARTGRIGLHRPQTNNRKDSNG